MPEYIIYELALLALAGVAARLALGAEARLAEQLCLSFCLKLLASCAIPFLTTALRINGPITYWVIAALALGGAVLLGRRLWPMSFNLPRRAAWGEAAAAGVVILYSAVIAIGRTGPIAETDSLVNFSYVIQWAGNVVSPYLMAYDYSSLWEMNFVPAVALRASDAVLWWPGAEAILLLGLALYLLASKVIDDRRLTWLTMAAVLSLPAFILVSGYGTLKNDMIYNAGALLLVLGLASRDDGRRALSAILTLSGITFLSVKFSGPLYATGVLLVWLALAWRRDRASIRQEIRFVLMVGVGALALGGHYYVKNILLFHNPLYPYPAKLGPVQLPGVNFLPTSSLLSRLKEPALWADFVHSPVYGLAGPVCVLGGLVMGLMLLFRPGPREPDVRDAEILVMGGCLLGGLIYVGSIFSDVLGPDLLSLRYVTAPVAMSFILLARGGRSLGPTWVGVVGTLLAWCVLSQGKMVFDLSFRYDDHGVVVAMTRHAVIAALFMIAIWLASANVRPAAIIVAAGAILLLGARMAEVNRARRWLPEWGPVVNHVARFRGGESIYLVTAFSELRPLPSSAPPRYLSLAQVLYPAIGPKFKNRVDFGDVDNLAAKLRKGQQYSGIAVEGWAQLDPAILQDITTAAAPYGYVMTDHSDLAAFYSRPASR